MTVSVRQLLTVLSISGPSCVLRSRHRAAHVHAASPNSARHSLGTLARLLDSAEPRPAAAAPTGPRSVDGGLSGAAWLHRRSADPAGRGGDGLARTDAG